MSGSGALPRAGEAHPDPLDDDLEPAVAEDLVDGVSAQDDAAPPSPAPPEPSPGGLAGLRRRVTDGHAPQALLAAFVAWSITLAPAAFGRGVPAIARAVSLVALLAGISGPLVAVGLPRPLRIGAALGPKRLGRLIGISLFLALATTTWLLSSAAIVPARLDPTRAAIGALAWGVFALSWSDRWSLGLAAPLDTAAPALPARATLPFAAVPLAGVAVAVAVSYTALAWRVRDPDRASLAHAVATGCAVWLLSASATVAVARGRRSPRLPRRVSAVAMRSLLVLVAVVIGGALVVAFR
jgi:hypothetical protein